MVVGFEYIVKYLRYLIYIAVSLILVSCSYSRVNVAQYAGCMNHIIDDIEVVYDGPDKAYVEKSSLFSHNVKRNIFRELSVSSEACRDEDVKCLSRCVAGLREDEENAGADAVERDKVRIVISYNIDRMSYNLVQQSYFEDSRVIYNIDYKLLVGNTNILSNRLSYTNSISNIDADYRYISVLESLDYDVAVVVADRVYRDIALYFVAVCDCFV